ncbi:hypothetical protein DAPPUDRAFT_118552 [Daphnia pulex]|uniref:Uncharacterized protein n=1 Tax=Daphnia pulex TaxID=6669 RepID=E9HVY9_DAPPU|nr:hypothetical protein DAPPUDRAFT_118552 [Daphnia pulex]|eukprot:EFX64093.1 hypothetical protein DAPPUDRAFT_118552 [Daphnia pulex]
MAQRSDDDNNVCKRKRLTGSSKWTMNAISRQIAESQANLDIENMVMLQQDQSSEKMCGSPKDLEVSPIYMESDFSQEPKNMKASFFFNDEMELQVQVLSTPTELIGFSPDVESILMESEFPEAEFDEEFNIIYEDDYEDPDEEDLELCEKAGNEFDRIQIVRLLSAAFYLKHGLSKSGLNDFLDILNVSSGHNQDDELRSPYMFMKRYGLLKGDLKRIYPCSTCSKTLKNGESGYPTEIQPCGHNYCKETSDKFYTLLLPV